jgi:4-hydroxybenzoate polyprenyltransferase
LNFRAWLQLVRFPNLFTVPGDPIAGFLIAYGEAHAGGGRLDHRVIFPVVASFCLYSAGLILNDLLDFAEDRRERPKRPLPSGQVKPQHAWIATALLALAGLAAMYAANGIAGVQLAGVLLASVVLYNGATKHIPVIGALNMGLCRGLSLLLGAAAATERAWPYAPIVIACAVIVVLYIAAVTNLARHETKPSSPMGARFLPVVVLLLAFLFFHAGRLPFLVSPATTGLAIALTLAAIEVGRLAGKNPLPLPAVIGGLIRVLLVIQAAIGLIFPSREGWIVACVLVAMVPIARQVGRKFYAS